MDFWGQSNSTHPQENFYEPQKSLLGQKVISNDGIWTLSYVKIFGPAGKPTTNFHCLQIDRKLII
jgi:hypothetical protein